MKDAIDDNRTNATWTAKYPFTEEAREYIRLHAPSLEEFSKEELEHILEYVFNRLKREIEGKGPVEWTREFETLFYPLAFAIIQATRNIVLQRIFADRESKKAFSHLREEETNDILHIGKSTFNLKLKHSEKDDNYLIYLMDYLKVASRFGGGRWKLTNRYVEDGFVYLDKRRTSRIIAEHVRLHIQRKMEEEITLPPIFLSYSERLLKQFKARIYEEVIFEEEYLRHKVDPAEFPPCIKHIYEVAVRGEGLSHMARFSLVTFLYTVGYSVDRIIKIFSRAPDFNPQKTRYQVEHITGSRGGRKKYRIPSCAKIRAFNLCVPDEFCRRLRHPLQYLRRKKKRK
ncbi:MAG: hypothetical protein GTO54_12250 [Nitrososphaeria archaeon]|nr:hypothetical protein [Nitrososphaeria archaeon]